ncbi:MAG: hypothetical protein JSW53_01545 [Candidatus Bathyarchaeota archaeon]|nr:MAG: hypothetical protein JSW53_01545 [Candidatus Bathyarchaeota archaeon]
MHRNMFRKGSITSILTITILAIMIITPHVPEVTAVSTTSITLINPISGPVGTEIRLNGTIETANGTYVLRWNETLNVTIANATDHDVHAVFTAPETVGEPFPGREVLIELIDNETGNIADTVFSLYTEYHMKAVVPSQPLQLQEGQETVIRLNVTGGAENTVYVANITVKDPADTTYWTAVSLTNTSTIGYGEGNVRFPGDFGGGAHTHYRGTYQAAFNETLATTDFTVGLSDKQEYTRRYFSEGEEETGEVIIQGAGYDDNAVTINIAYYNETTLTPVEGYPKEENASDGILIHEWKIPEDAVLATYNITLTCASIEKSVKDTQNFTLIEIIVSCQAQNRHDNDSLDGISVKAYRGALGFFYIDNRTTNGTGWVDFLLDHGQYSFGAYWREVEVGSLSLINPAGNSTDYILRMEQHIECDLARVTMVASDEDGPIPFISVALANATTAPQTIPPFQTDYTGIISTYAFTGIPYRIEARRYGHLFFNESIGNLTETIGNLTYPFLIQCPTYTLFIHAMDSNSHPIQNVPLEVIEWSSGSVVGEGDTSEWGSIRINCTFGRYKARVYNQEQTVILNETIVDVTQDQFYLVLDCKTVNLDLSVKVTDYLGQPIPNAVVKIEREDIPLLNLTTGPDGVASEQGILGGDYRISLHIAGRISKVRSLYFDGAEDIVFQAANYLVVGGYPLEVNQLTTGIAVTILVVAFVSLILVYRRRPKES